MDFETYKGSLAQDTPPEELSPAAQALVVGGQGRLAPGASMCPETGRQPKAPGHTPICHRVEGDLSNAGGCTVRAGRPSSTAPLKEEWETIARALLA